MDLLTSLYIVGNILLPTGFLIFLSDQALKSTRRFSRGFSLLLAAGYIGACFAICLLGQTPFYPFRNPHIFPMLILLVSFLYLSARYRATPCVLLFVLFFVKVFMDNVFVLSKLLQVLLSGQICNPERLQIYGAAYLVTFGISVPLIAFLERKLLVPLIRDNPTHLFWRYLCFIPLSHYLVYQFGALPDYTSPEAMPQQSHIILQLSWILMTLFSYLMLLLMMGRLIRDQERIHTLQTEALCRSVQQSQYEKMQAQFEETRQIRHDFRHHLLILRDYVHTGDLEAIERYLDGYLDSLTPSGITLCANPAVNALAGYYLLRSQKHGIAFDYSLRLPEHLPVLEKDLCIILANLLENAYEACCRQSGGERFITVKLALTGKQMLFLTVRNSYAGELTPVGNSFLSSKRDEPGIGISSVRGTVQRCGGELSISYDGSVFQASVFLNGALETEEKTEKEKN